MESLGDGNGDTAITWFIVTSVITISLSLVGIGARTYTRVALTKQFGITDCVLLLTGVLLVALVLVVWRTSLVDALMTQNIFEILYCPTMFGAKYVVLRQIELVFFSHRRQALAPTAIRVLIWANLLFYAAVFVSSLLACIPRAKISDPNLPGTCIDAHVAIIASSALNVVSDFTILVTPIAAIWQLQVPARRKLGALAVFGVGVVATVTSIVRLYYSILLARNNPAISNSFTVWVLAELTAVILVACLPHLPRLYHHLSLKFQNSRHHISDDGAENELKTPKPSALRPLPENIDNTPTALRLPGDNLDAASAGETKLNGHTQNTTGYLDSV